MTKKVALTAASEDDLRAFARDTLGLNLPPNTKLDTLRAKISAAWDQDYVVVDDAAEPPAIEGDAPRPATKAQQLPPKGKVRVILNVTEDAGGTEPVPVGVNGKIMLVPRGKEVDIPESYFEVLANAISHKYDPLPDGGINPIPRKVPLYPFQRVA